MTLKRDEKRKLERLLKGLKEGSRTCYCIVLVVVVPEMNSMNLGHVQFASVTMKTVKVSAGPITRSASTDSMPPVELPGSLSTRSAQCVEQNISLILRRRRKI